MSYAVFRCCVTTPFLREYETSTNAVLKALGLEYTDVAEFNCCGQPLKNVDFFAYVLASARNLALAGQRQASILTFCNCCWSNLRHAHALLANDAALRDKAQAVLDKEGLALPEQDNVVHLLELLYRDLGPEQIKAKVAKPLNGLSVAVHYGCHVLRPSQVERFDDPGNPVFFERLVEAAGASCAQWETRLDCCGSPAWGAADDTAVLLGERKQRDAAKSGAKAICAACPFCRIQMDKMKGRMEPGQALPTVLYTQLLGLALGLEAKELGLDPALSETLLS